MKPLVSIVLPTYNRAHTIHKSVESLLTQTYQDIEIIVVDDGSTDNTQQIINDLQEQDPRIRYLKQPHQKGANTARNRGVREAKGEYIAFQDSDDHWLPHKLAAQMDAIQITGVKAAFTAFWKIQGQKKIQIPKKNRGIKPGTHSFHKELLKGNFIALPTFVVEKGLVQQAGEFDEKLPRLQDWEMFLRLSRLTDFIYINQPMLNAYIGSDNITSKKHLYRKSLEFIIKKHRDDFEAHPVALAIQNANLLIDATKEKKVKQVFSYICNAFLPGIKPVLRLATEKIMACCIRKR